jgi:flavin reductase (DIM6/NTAB) family NADH-FMN oxidoreductase RutF
MTNAQASFTPRQFRSALGLFPTGVTVVTALSSASRRIGVTVNSFTSVSLEPPLVSFSLAKSLGSLAELLLAPSCVINVLTAAQAETSARFARPGADKWTRAACRIAASGNPVLLRTWRISNARATRCTRPATISSSCNPQTD